MKVKPAHYVNNRDLLERLIVRKAENLARAERGEEKLPLDNFLGSVIINIATRLSYRPNFINYSFKDEMIDDAIENGLVAIDKFDPDKSENPFAYLTQIMWHAFVRRIVIEQKQQRIKGALIAELPLDDLFETQEHDEDGVQYSHHMMDFLRENNFIHDKVNKDVKPEIHPKGLEKFYD